MQVTGVVVRPVDRWVRVFRLLAMPDPRYPTDMETPDEWTAELEQYARAVLSNGVLLKKRRLMRAKLDGGWGRLQTTVAC